MKEKLLTISQVAEQLGVSDSTVRRMADSGLIDHVRLPKSGYRRFTQVSVDRVLEQMEQMGKAVA